jgi:hypothetical protein
MALWITSRCPFYQGKGYGGLDFSPTLLNRAFGMTWSVGELYKRVADEINTTFAIIAKYNAKTTDGKYILNPNKG